MLGLPGDRGGAGEPAPRPDQLVGVEGPPAVVALVTPRRVVPAMGASPFDVTVGEEPLGLGVVELDARLRGDVAALPQRAEDVPGDLTVVLGHGGREEVERDPQTLPVAKDFGVVSVDDFPRCGALLVGFDRYRGAVGVGAGHHEHPVAR